MNVSVGPFFILMIIGGLVAGIAVLLKLIRKYPELSHGVFLAYAMISIFVSLIYLETHAVFISEAAASSEAIGAAARFAILNGSIIAGMFAVFRLSKPLKAIRTPTTFEVRGSIYILFFVIGSLLANLLISSSTAFPWGQATRFDYWQNFAAIPQLQDLYGTFAIFVPFVASALLVYSLENEWKNIRNISVAILLCYFVFLLGTGQVFHGHLVPATIVTGTYMIWKAVKRQRIISGRVLLALSVFAIIASMVSITSLGQRGIATDGGRQAAVYRLLVVQGGVVWRADDLRQRGFDGSYRHLLEGRTFLIRTILPANLADQYEERGVNLQGALPSTAYLAIGFIPSLIFCFIYGMLCGAVMRLMTWLLMTGQLLLMFPASFLWLWVMVAYSRASLETLLTLSFAAATVLVAGWIFLRPLPRGRSSRIVPVAGPRPLTRKIMPRRVPRRPPSSFGA